MLRERIDMSESHEHVLVTAIYGYNSYERIGGRGYNIRYYQAAFLNVMKLGLPVVIYTDKSETDNLVRFMEEHNITNYHLEIFDLTTVPFMDRILELKEQAGLIDKDGLVSGVSPVANDRNHTLCLYKPSFVKNAIDKNIFNGKNYYWVDAGVFHHGMFPPSMGGMEYYVAVDAQNYWPHLTTTLFRPGLVENLQKKAPNNFILLHALQGHGTPDWWTDVMNVPFKGWIVAGLFGGPKETFLEFYEYFETVRKKVLDLGRLALEEPIISAYYAELYNQDTPFKFETWYHDIPEERCGVSMDPGTKCFYKIFKVHD